FCEDISLRGASDELSRQAVLFAGDDTGGRAGDPNCLNSGVDRLKFWMIVGAGETDRTAVAREGVEHLERHGKVEGVTSEFATHEGAAFVDVLIGAVRRSEQSAFREILRVRVVEKGPGRDRIRPGRQSR